VARVLVVEDNPQIRELIGIYVKQAGHAVAMATDGADALDQVEQRGAPDIAVMDVVMPGMTGLELLVELRGKPGMAELPAIFLSSRVRPEDIALGTDLGATYLTKPFVGSALIATINKLLPTKAEQW
jgi:DNA-binding response OmpR family regulator